METHRDSPQGAGGREAALAALEWLVEMGVDEAMEEAPLDRFALERAPRQAAAMPAPAVAQAAGGDAAPDSHAAAVAEAEALAAGAATLAALAEAMAAFARCDLRLGATSLVFADGRPGARVMIVGDAPGRAEDREGRPFAGAGGRLLDAMFAAIGLARDAERPDEALYLASVLPWRPPHDREPEAAEIAMLRPFLARHVALADPEILLLAGNQPCAALLGRRGIARLRGGWTEALGRPALPVFAPSHLLETPAARREAWADLLGLKARLTGARP